MGELLRRLLYLLRYRHRQDDLAEELEFHREMKQQQLTRDGMDSAIASIAARCSFGNDLTSRQQSTDVWITPWLREIYQDLRFAIRLLAKDRGFTVTAILVLGVGMGVNNMMFTLIYTHTMRSLPIPDADRVLYISLSDERTPDRPLSYPELVDIEDASTFQGIAAYTNAPMAIGDEGRAPERFEGLYVTANAMTVVGVRPVLGRSFTADEDTPGASRAAIIGSNVWRTRYGSDSGILGRTILVDGVPATVVGVMPQRSGFPTSAEVWLPLSHMPGPARHRGDQPMLRVLGRVRDGIDATVAMLEIESIVERTSREHAERSSEIRARVVPINSRFLGRATDPAWLAFLAASFIVVLVSAANVANLMIARSALRAREIAIRTSIGANRWRILRQMLTESVALAGVGGIVALAVSVFGVRAFRSAIPENTLPYWIDYTMDARVLGALVGVAFGTVLVFGLVPALQASRIDVNRVLKDGGRMGSGARGARGATTLFLTAQFALTVVLLANGVGQIRSHTPRVPSDVIVKSPDLMTASVSLPTARYTTPQQRENFYRLLDERLRAIPGTRGVSMATTLPSRVPSEQRLELFGRPTADTSTAPTVWSLAIAPKYFETLSLSLPVGREFNWDDGTPGHPHAIVNQRFVELFLPDSDPIGQRISLRSPNAPAAEPVWLTVVGVAQDIRQHPAPDPIPLVYVPLRFTSPSTAALIVRSTVDRSALTAGLRDQLQRLDSNLPLYRMMTMSQAIEDAEWNGRLSGRLLFSITLLVLTLSVVGLYAMTAYAVAQRGQEIGIRIAVGARPWQVRREVLRRAFVQVWIGFAVGMVCTFAWNAAFSTGRPDLSFASLGNLASVAAVLAATVLMACLMPVRRATRLDPVAVLRNE